MVATHIEMIRLVGVRSSTVWFRRLVCVFKIQHDFCYIALNVSRSSICSSCLADDFFFLTTRPTFASMPMTCCRVQKWRWMTSNESTLCSLMSHAPHNSWKSISRSSCSVKSVSKFWTSSCSQFFYIFFFNLPGDCKLLSLTVHRNWGFVHIKRKKKIIRLSCLLRVRCTYCK